MVTKKALLSLVCLFSLLENINVMIDNQGWVNYKSFVVRYNYSYFKKYICSQLQLLLLLNKSS